MGPSTPAERRHLAKRCRTCCLRRFRASRPPQNSSFRGSIPHPIRSLCTLRTRRRRRLRNTRFPAARYHLTGADLSPAETRQLRLTHRNRKFESISLQRRVRTKPTHRRTISAGNAVLTGDRWFESISLQQTVRLAPASAIERRKARLSARVCAAGLATGSAETRRVFRYRANRRQYLCRAIFQYRSAADGVGENAALHPTKLGLHWAYISCAVDLSIRMELRQSRARSADRARQAADGSARGGSPP